MPGPDAGRESAPSVALHDAIVEETTGAKNQEKKKKGKITRKENEMINNNSCGDWYSCVLWLYTIIKTSHYTSTHTHARTHLHTHTYTDTK